MTEEFGVEGHRFMDVQHLSTDGAMAKPDNKNLRTKYIIFSIGMMSVYVCMHRERMRRYNL